MNYSNVGMRVESDCEKAVPKPTCISVRIKVSSWDLLDVMKFVADYNDRPDKDYTIYATLISEDYERYLWLEYRDDPRTVSR